MISNTFNWIAETLFYLMNGEPLINSFWIILWVLGGTVLMVIPFYFAVSVGRNRVRSLPAVVSLVSFFPLLLLIMGPPLTQMQMLSECETVTITIDTDRVEGHAFQMRQCRHKENFYGDFGEWSLFQKPT